MNENAIIAFIRMIGGWGTGFLDFLAQTPDFLCGFLVAVVIVGVPVVKGIQAILQRMG